ncbi:SAM-dependent methyltransferase [Saxibacter everestensis]|uniref:SAM-dependent methyltransferase n=1 Tax=Saxibacter everestensis TaxID=2909229 RepID=A0ABY8QXC3_9MICO|nr:SAM-dependent methyltransferase [Brevibacteriaceae bacterium ZFBP1038]
MDADSLKLLLDPAGFALLNELPPYDESESLRLSEQLRAAGHPAELVAAALTQSRLRDKATSKFGAFAADMLFTADGLEQATRLSVAARHANRFAQAGIEKIADLGCGIGADAMAMAALDRQVLAVDADEVTAAIASVNLRHLPTATVRHARAEDTDLSGFDGAWLDPARRSPGRSDSQGRTSRIFDPEAFSPPLSFVTSLAADLPALGAKLGPALPHEEIPLGAEAQWTSVGGSVVEVALWWNATARKGVRRAALVIGRDGGVAEATDIDLPEQAVGEIGGFLYEPDGAVIRSGLVTALLPITTGRLIDPKIAYVTSDVAVSTPLATGWQVEDVLPFSLKKLRGYLRERNIGILTIKKRGSAIVPEQLRKQLRLEGSEEATIVVTKVRGKQVVIMVRPLIGADVRVAP